MCNKVSTPNKDQLEGYFKKDVPNASRIITVRDFKQYFHADGFARPFLPFTAAEQPDVVTTARWKLLPYIVKNEAEAIKYANTLNARSEEIFDKFSYKSSINSTRGLLWVNGFFEPNHPAPKKTVPYFIRAHNFEPFSLGCVYTNWVDQDTGEAFKTFSIITTPPNQLLTQIHNEGQRMPLIIPPHERDRWLGPLTKNEITALMQPLPDGYLTGYAVSALVYKRGIDTNVPETQLPLAG